MEPREHEIEVFHEGMPYLVQIILPASVVIHDDGDGGHFIAINPLDALKLATDLLKEVQPMFEEYGGEK